MPEGELRAGGELEGEREAADGRHARRGQPWRLRWPPRLCSVNRGEKRLQVGWAAL